MTARRTTVAALATLLAAALVLAVLGQASWALPAAAAVPWMLIASRRWGIVLGAPVVLLTGLVAFELLLMASGALHLPLPVSVHVPALAAGTAGVVLCARTGVEIRPRRVLLLVPLLLGSVVWIATLAVAQLLPGASRLSWVMLGDAANNVLFAREIVAAGGITVGPTENPVPLPAAVLGFIMSAGRDSTAPADLLRHDLTGFAVAWTILIVLCCLLAGALVAAIARRRAASAPVTGIVGALGSLLPLTWFFSGYPVEFGFFNTQLALIVICASLLGFLRSTQSPVAALVAQVLAAILLLAIWSPLVLMPAALGLVIVIRGWRVLLAARGASAVALIGSLVLGVAYVGIVVVPPLLRQAGFLAAIGGIIGFPKWLVVALAVIAVLLAVLAAGSLRDTVVLGTATTAAACGAGIAALLAASGSWSYYPLKLAWLGSAVLILLMAGNLAAALVSRVPHRGAFAVLLPSAALLVSAMVLWLPSAGGAASGDTAVQRVLRGDYLGQGDEIADRVMALADPTVPRLLWSSGVAGESVIDFWLLQLYSQSVDDTFELRVAAYSMYEPTSIDDLCDTVSLMGEGTEVITADENLEDEMLQACPTIAALATFDEN